MLNLREQVFDEILIEIAQSLDITPYQYSQAMERYDSLRNHLEKGNYPEVAKCPDVYVQGSFRLGTVVRPYIQGKDTNYDIDIVCELDSSKNSTMPEHLKRDVGSEVKAYTDKYNMKDPKDKRRCWALEYSPDSGAIGFHVDVLPSIPDPELAIEISYNNPSINRYEETTIAITDRDDELIEYNWRSSNPKGYAKWFYDINQPGFVIIEREHKQSLFESNRELYINAEEVPNELVRTPLQRSIQILKRHRDVYFAGHKLENNKPISMIITTLASRLYEGRADQLRTVHSALTYIVEHLTAHESLLEPIPYLSEDISVLKLIQQVGNRWYIPNPVNPHYPGDPTDKGENFADRWHEDNHVGARAFFEWIANLKSHFDNILISATSDDIEKMLASSLKLSSKSQSVDNKINPSIIVPSLTSLNNFFVPHRQNIPWQENCRYDVSLSGKYKHNEKWNLFNSNSKLLNKGCSLLFTARTNAPKPFKVYWQVVNTGPEAERANDLRGNIYLSKLNSIRGLEKEECTKYTGMHWIECFIVKNQCCVARSGEFVVNIK